MWIGGVVRPLGAGHVGYNMRAIALAASAGPQGPESGRTLESDMITMTSVELVGGSAAYPLAPVNVSSWPRRHRRDIVARVIKYWILHIERLQPWTYCMSVTVELPRSRIE
jgi:hypothetical protein